MLDIRAIRENPEPFRAGLARRNLADAVDSLLAADERRRELTTRVEELRARQNRLSRRIGAAQGDERRALVAGGGGGSGRLKEVETPLGEAQPAPAGLLGS